MQIGQNHIEIPFSKGTGKFVTIAGERFYKIEGSDALEPFFLTLVSSSDQWLFMGSNGGITAGRRSPEYALFPYETDDKIIQNADHTGSKTLVKWTKEGGTFLWEPFADNYLGIYAVERNLYKNVVGNKFITEEINYTLNARFTYQWTFSNQFGFVKQSTLENLSKEAVKAELLDGVQNILPAGVVLAMQQSRSTLVDAYKRSELDSETGLGIFALSAQIVDKAEPSESLKATTVWSAGIPVRNYLLSSRQLRAFKLGQVLSPEADVKGEKGAFFIHADVSLKSFESQEWVMVAEVEQSTADVVSLQKKLTQTSIVDQLKADIETGSKALWELVAKADGVQVTGDELSATRHYSNVLFNIMRGGIFEDGYRLQKQDFTVYVAQSNHSLFERHADFFEQLPEHLSYPQLIELSEAYNQSDVKRLSLEYLPLSFSRRHGDPSRPWNHFVIDIQDEKGNKSLNYQGNWRDIFQNWEALAYSFPRYIHGMIAKFVNASTRDGYNPYRITRSGIDWEVIEPDDAWSFIGYWGDHQIIYLLKLLEHSEQHFPGQIQQWLNEKIFVFANVPYKIKGFEQIWNNPSDTIDFDHEAQAEIDNKVAELGADGKLLPKLDAGLMKVNLTEKLLIPFLTKLYNLVPDGGIWLNTQRPEWNDANNALVGNGLSMVTLNYMIRMNRFLLRLFEESRGTSIQVTESLKDLIQEIHAVLSSFESVLDEGFNGTDRKLFVVQLGQIGAVYRSKIYASTEAKFSSLAKEELIQLLELSNSYLKASFHNSGQANGLYSAYNLMKRTEESVEIEPLYDMLEGQVAALSALELSTDKALKVLDALKESALFRADQYSYVLYPNKDLKGFLIKNNISEDQVETVGLLKRLMEQDDHTLIQQSSEGTVHFAPSIHNSKDIQACLADLKANGWEVSSAEEKTIEAIFEKVFNHHAFTGRSGTFFGYEGLGSIYWHMVSKLLLVNQELLKQAHTQQVGKELEGRLIDHYYEIRAGIGINKTPLLYGGFPIDPYSHTPANAGVQQPGMTGQVKEDVMNRWAELGVEVKEGIIYFDPFFMNQGECLKKDGRLECLDVKGGEVVIDLPPQTLAFTYCGIPVIYKKGDHTFAQIHYREGYVKSVDAKQLPIEDSQAIFNRDNTIKQITINVCYDA